MLELLLGQIPEAIYFSLFLIYTKELKEKKILFTILMVMEYLLWIYTFKYNFIFHIGFMFNTFVILKVLYGNKSQITDIFLVLVAYISMMMFSFIAYPLIGINYYLAVIVNRIIMILFIVIFRNKLKKIQNIYKKLWNRNDKENKRIKTTTFRCANIFIFNIIFYVLNLLMIYVAYYNNLK